MHRTRVYLSPGMFGFADLAGVSYFGHFVREIEKRFEEAGKRAEIRVCEVHPTSSVRRRSAKLVKMVASTCGERGPIHIVGHSTGGLDGRLVASPTVHIDAESDRMLGWIDRLRSVTSINAPHFGTPLASFFATAKGQRMLYAVSAITVTALKLGAPPLTVASALIASLGRTRETMGIELALVDKVTESTAKALDDAASQQLRSWLQEVRDDQGGVVQLMPEAMDLFQAGVENRPGVSYHCVASYAPPSTSVRQWLGAVRRPWIAVSAPLFHFMYRITAVHETRYPCTAPADACATLRSMYRAANPGSEPPPDTANDGVVPLYSQLWGKLLWVGRGDHLDVVGHFPGRGGHNDWLASGSRFDLDRFDMVVDRIVSAILAAE